VILSNTGLDNILYADEAMNITDEVVAGLNARYVSEKKK
jgi:outer membrane protein